MLISLLVTEALAVAVAFGAMAVTAVIAWRKNKVSVVDITWGLALVGVAVVGALRGGWPSVVLLGVVALWGGRLSSHIARRAHGAGEDPRYRDMLGGSVRDVGLGKTVSKVFAVQGLAVCLVSLPLVSLAAFGLTSPVVFGFGVVVALIGLVFEAVGDAQLTAYKTIPKDDRPQVLDTGLWAWTRHPNYFGDALFWTGIWIAGGLAAGNHWLPGLLTVLSPIAMTMFLWFVTGARLLERTMMNRPGYREYASRTPMFVPRPPR